MAIDVSEFQAAVTQTDIDAHSTSAANYNPSTKPNMREFGMIRAGLNPGSASDHAAYNAALVAGGAAPDSDIGKAMSANNAGASEALYGVVGSNTDTRNWEAIQSAASAGADINQVVGAATGAMYGGVTPQLVNGALVLVSGNGIVLRGVSPKDTKAFQKELTKFGVSDTEWGNTLATQIDTYRTSQTEAQATFQGIINDPTSTAQERADAQIGIDRSIKIVESIGVRQAEVNDFIGLGEEFFAPFSKYDIDGSKYITGLSTSTLKPKTIEEDEDETLGVVEQTIQAPEVVTPDTTNVAIPGSGYQAAPQAPAAVVATTATPSYLQPTTQTPYTPAPTTTTGQPIDTGVTGTGVFPQAPVTGSMATGLQTAGLSAVPETVQARPDYTGTNMANLTSQSQQGFGGMRTYENTATGQQMMITVDASGKPMTYVPPGFTLKQGMYEGGAVQGYAAGGTVDSALLIIAKMNGFGGEDIDSAKTFMNSSEGLRRKARAVGVAMNKGGMTKKPIYAAEGTFVQEQAERDASLIEQTMQPMQANVQYIQPQAADFIGSTAGQATPVAPMAQTAQVGSVQQAQMPMMTATDTAAFTPAYAGVQAETAGTQAAQGVVSTQAQPIAAQQQTSAVTGMTAAQGTATMVNAPAAREIQAGEIISGVADAEKAATFNEQIQAATATPSTQATVQGQLEGLMQQFEGGNTPAWAAGSMRAATATLAARGLGASSMAGQAIIQASMEAALPIAQMDAQVQAQFEGQNLSNRQARAMLSAQQRAQFLGMEFDQAFQARVQNSARVGDIANMNFTAEQNIALENSRSANTMNLNNLSNRQAMVMAEAAALSNLDMANLNNRQQTAVQNAQNFMQMDMTNLSNEQQTTMFKSQQNIQALFTDQAAENAAAQFNASSENQTNQFFANLASQTGQFNASQQNAMDQFNVNSVNALREFNSEIQQQRDLFNAQNGLVIAQSNAQWRQNLTTLNTAAQNESNMDFAKTMAGFTARNLDSYWQTERDIMSFAFQTENNNADRATSIALQNLKNEAGADEAAASKSSIFSKLAGSFVDKVIF